MFSGDQEYEVNLNHLKNDHNKQACDKVIKINCLAFL